MNSSVKRLLFVCVENSNRSQMAEAFARLHGGAGIEAYSAGSRPGGSVNPQAVEMMRELGYEMSTDHGDRTGAGCFADGSMAQKPKAAGDHSFRSRQPVWQ